MKKLKRLRLSYKWTQAHLADMLKTTQQTVARWETGKSEPSHAALKDLALLFSTSIDDLLGCNPLSAAGKDGITTNLYHALAGSDDGFWGHLGIRAPGAAKSIWYPITRSEANRIGKSLASRTADKPWMVACTLNNRALLIHASAVPQISILDDNADQDDADWEIGWDGCQGFSTEIYWGLEDHFLGFEAEDDDSQASEAFRGTIEQLIDEEKMDEDRFLSLVCSTRVYFCDGTLRELRVDDETSWDAFCLTELEDDAATLDLSDEESGLNVYVARRQVALVDMPLHRMSNAAKHEFAELEREATQPAADRAGAQAQAKSSLKSRQHRTVKTT